MKHFTTEDILAYLSDKLSQEEVFRIEAHLTTCEECARRIDDHIVIREHFDEIWDSWTGQRHSQEIFQMRVLESIVQAEISSGLKERATAWAQRISRKTQAALGIVMDASQKAAKVLSDGLDSVFPSETILAFSPVSQPVRTTGVGTEKGILVEAKGPPWVEVSVDPSERNVTVRTREMPPPWPLVMLMPKGKGRALIEAFEHPEDTDFLLAEFVNIPDDDYILLLEGQNENEA